MSYLTRKADVSMAFFSGAQKMIEVATNTFRKMARARAGGGEAARLAEGGGVRRGSTLLTPQN